MRYHKNNVIVLLSSKEFHFWPIEHFLKSFQSRLGMKFKQPSMLFWVRRFFLGGDTFAHRPLKTTVFILNLYFVFAQVVFFLTD